jgi:NAD(P)-dependent dehydrogenase (short-subunit alcohol dehydrogenase family)
MVTSADVVLVVLDGTERTRTLVRGLVDNDIRTALTSASVHELVPLLNGVRRGLVYGVVADPSDAGQVDRLFERVGRTLGAVTVILDPGERLTGNRAASHAA